MKQKVSITIEEAAIKDIDEALLTGKFRNKSHFIEYAVKRLLDNEKAEQQKTERQLKWG